MKGPHENAEVPQHDVAWIRLMYEVVPEVTDTHYHESCKAVHKSVRTRKRVSSHLLTNFSVNGPRGSCSQQGYTSGPSAPKDHLYDALLNGSHGDTCWWPSVKNCSNFRKDCTSITLNDSHQSWLVPFSHDLSRPQICRKFDVLPDSRYSRYTREMIVLENPNFIATSEMLCPISRAPAIKPRSNSLKS
ncbi:uncharacterized protein TNCV_901591 [Trichonephila clavipes]|nr:uncharacterized protein TNCV_901591 [Trichonephila clavipes]